MNNKVMIIIYNDTGGCCISNYQDGCISMEHEEREARDKYGSLIFTVPKYDNIEMKEMKSADITLDELNTIISNLTSLRIRLLQTRN